MSPTGRWKNETGLLFPVSHAESESMLHSHSSRYPGAYMLIYGVCRLKCNRSLPCDTCLRRNQSSLCNYTANANRSKPGPSKERDLKDRLKTLENLVSSFLSGEATIHPGLAAESETAGIGENAARSVEEYERFAKQGSLLSSSSGGEDMLTPETPHLQETGNGQVNYIDPSHWLSILDDIKEVREHLSVSKLPVSHIETVIGKDCAEPDASFLFNSNQNLSLDDVINSLPSQPICDMLLSWYFNSSFMVLGKI